MKPVKLAIEGINSFTDRQEIDFDAVGRSNLFCICGAMEAEIVACRKYLGEY